MREDIFELAEYGRDLGFIIALGTNGTLIDQAMVERIKAAGIGSVAVSIDSARSEVHDDFRGMDGAWFKTIQAIRLMVKAGLGVQVNFTISKMNKDEISQVISLAEDLEARSFHALFLVETGRGEDLGHAYLSREEYAKAIEEVLAYESDMYIRPVCAPQAMVKAEEMGLGDRFSKGCLAGLSYCSVLPDGQVHICPYAQVKAGDLREASFDEIWEKSPVFQALRDFDNVDSPCGSCRHKSLCGGCRARALSKTGDYLAYDHYCLL